ncbi:hypothetical protein M3638_01365 [Oceanobacillus profundus]|uniref:hypothetical protein n=1 Tax=Oceanobacillus profundus TaxID=372463 RepID=UPI00203FD31D|nr:hypothetical protein [Oceanobacillus profundus]MCM3396483.1 hypothetical protein [Oceanobacillus profundus]
MPKYIAKSYLVHKGKIIPTDGELELTKEQAERLGEKVTLFEGTDKNEGYTEAELKKKSADEQKEIAEKLGGDLEDLTNEEKRINFILENQ